MGDDAEGLGGLPGDLRVMTVSFPVQPTFITLLVYDYAHAYCVVTLVVG